MLQVNDDMLQVLDNYGRLVTVLDDYAKQVACFGQVTDLERLRKACYKFETTTDGVLTDFERQRTTCYGFRATTVDGLHVLDDYGRHVIGFGRL